MGSDETAPNGPAQCDAAAVSPPVSTRAGWGCAVAILLLAAVLRFWALDFGFPHLRARPDETPVIEHSTAPSRGEFELSWSAYPNAYVYACWIWGEGALGLGRTLGQVSQLDYTSWLRERPESVFLVQRSASALAGVIAVALLMVLARRELGGRAALIAGLILATNFLHARDSHGVKPDVPLSLAVVAALFAMLPLARAATLRRALVAGAAVGVAMACKYTALVMVVPLYTAAWLGVALRGWRRWISLPAFAAGCGAAIVFLATNPLLFFNAESRDLLGRIVQTVLPKLAGSAPGAEASVLVPASKLWSPEPSTYRSTAWWGAAAYHFSFSLRHGAGVLFVALAPLAVLWGLLNRGLLVALASITALSFFGVIALSPVVHARYMTPLIPVLALLIAGMLTAGASLLARRAGSRKADLVLLACSLLLVAQPLASIVAHNSIASRTDTRAQAYRWLESHARSGDRVMRMGTRFRTWGAPRLPKKLVAIRAAESLRELRSSRARYVVTHDHPLFWSSLDADEFAELAPALKLREEFDPGAGTWDGAIFEPTDAYYIPFARFRDVERGGPRVQIFEVLGSARPPPRASQRRRRSP